MTILFCSDDSPEGVREKLVPAFLRGISSHHAGCLPAWKALVERCFQKGLLKLVFATGAELKWTCDTLSGECLRQ
jgi:superfamily II RNA helicase